ncbi:hypothetical protein R4K92_07855 [Brachyspira intermedia]|uniref:hypothetical protein n=1 Tax=Brachyspira intermedia TaxID=84377 RepID=UPI003007AE82
MKIKVIKIVSFFLIFFILLVIIINILIFQDTRGLYQTSCFYNQPKNSIDVLFIGNSHSFCDINPAILYNEYGIASYNFATGESAIYLVYFYLKEALKTQKPKLIVLEPHSAVRDFHYLTMKALFNSIPSFKLSKNKIEALKVSTGKDDYISFLNPLYYYNNRYSNINRDDFIFKEELKYFKGHLMFSNSIPQIEPNNDNMYLSKELPIKMYEYLKKIIELSKTNNINLLISVSPYIIYDETEQLQFNSIKEIADNYDINFINFNFNYDDYDLNFDEDFNDPHHLNYKGSEKFTKYLGKYLKENYDLPDRRGDTKYYSWEMNAKYEYKHIYNLELKNLLSLNDYIEKVKNADDYVVGITMIGNYHNNDVVVQSIASNFNINDIYLQNSSYVIDNNKLIYSSSGSNNYLFYKEIGNYTDLVIDSGQKLSINRTNYIKTQNGINIIIYDKFTEEILDNIYLEYQGNAINPTIKR